MDKVCAMCGDIRNAADPEASAHHQLCNPCLIDIEETIDANAYACFSDDDYAEGNIPF